MTSPRVHDLTNSMICVRPATTDSVDGDTVTPPPLRRIRSGTPVPAALLSSGKRQRKSPFASERVNGVPAGGTGGPDHISTVRLATGCDVALVMCPRTAVSVSGGLT